MRIIHCTFLTILSKYCHLPRIPNSVPTSIGVAGDEVKLASVFDTLIKALWWLIGRLQINIEERAFPLTDVTFNRACECPVEHEELLVFIVSFPEKAFMFTSAGTAGAWQ